MANTVLTIPGELCDLNTYIGRERGHRMSAAFVKKQETERVAWIARQVSIGNDQLPIQRPVVVNILWVTTSSRKDPDNVAFAIKFVLDGLVAGGVLVSDSRKWIEEIHHRFTTDRTNPRVEIVLEGADDAKSE